MLDVRLCHDRASWDHSVNALGGHPLQLWGWGELKAKHNWNVERVQVLDSGQVVGACQILLRKVSGFGEAVLYAPRGPVWAEGRGEEVVDTLIAYIRRSKRGLVFTVEPDSPVMPQAARFRRAARTILMPHTLIIDIAQSEEDLLSRMKGKTRQYVRKSLRDDALDVRRVRDEGAIREALAVYRETAERDGFPLHPESYYLDVHRELGDDSQLFVAYADERPVALLWNVVSGTTAFELYGGMNAAGKRLRANFALKWTAIQTAKAGGASRYDLNGLLNDGITEFKQGFATDHPSDDLAGSFDLPLSPFYRVYRDGLPLAQQGMRLVAEVRHEGLLSTYRHKVLPVVGQATKQARRFTMLPFRAPDPTIRRREDRSGDDA